MVKHCTVLLCLVGVSLCGCSTTTVQRRFYVVAENKSSQCRIAPCFAWTYQALNSPRQGTLSSFGVNLPQVSASSRVQTLDEIKNGRVIAFGRVERVENGGRLLQVQGVCFAMDAPHGLPRNTSYWRVWTMGQRYRALFLNTQTSYTADGLEFAPQLKAQPGLRELMRRGFIVVAGELSDLPPRVLHVSAIFSCMPDDVLQELHN